MTYDATILAESGLIAYWPLNDTGSTATDATGNGHTLTLASGVTTGSTSLLPGDSETAMAWGAGVSSASTVAGPSAFALSTFSAEFWTDYTTVPTSGFLHMVSAAGSTPSGGFGAGYRGGTGWLLTTYGRADTTFTATATAGTVYHVVFTRDSSGNLALYLNGSLQQTVTGSAITTSSATWSVTLGGLAADSQYLKGTLQKVAIYNVALSATQVSNHYNAGQSSALAGSATIGGTTGGMSASGSTVVTGASTTGSTTGGISGSGSTVLTRSATLGSTIGGLGATGSTILSGSATTGSTQGGISATGSAVLFDVVSLGSTLGGVSVSGTAILLPSVVIGATSGGLDATAVQTQVGAATLGTLLGGLVPVGLLINPNFKTPTATVASAFAPSATVTHATAATATVVSALRPTATIRRA